MLNQIKINQNISQQENVTYNALIIFDVMRQLIDLGNTNVDMFEHKIVNDEVYTVLPKVEILQAIPRALMRSRTLTKVISELKDAGLIKQDLNSTKKPAYRLTKKSKQYIL